MKPYMFWWGCFLTLAGVCGPRLAAADLDAALRIREFDLKSLRDSLPVDLGRVILTLENSPVFSDTPVIKWLTDSTSEAMRFGEDTPWVQGKVIALDVYYDSEHAGMMQLRFYAKGEKTPRLGASISLFPRLRSRITFPLQLLDGQRVFMDRNPGRLKGVIWGRRLPVEDLSHVTLAMEATGDRQTLLLANLVLLKGEPECPLPNQVVVDSLGQWKGRDWPTKTPDETALKQQLQAARANAASAQFPDSWSRFGGTRKKTFKATGFFRAENDGRRWWLVDPEGCGFFSTGMDCVRAGESTAILPGSEKLFEWLPDRSGPYAAAFGRNRGSVAFFDFARANLIRCFGAEWARQWADMTCGRLRAWRFNTIANWSELDLLKGASLPYVIQLGRYPTTPTLLFRDFPDVYDPQFRTAARDYARALEGYRKDPFLVGYFLCNEPVWGFGKHNLAAEMLEANPDTATRRELVRWLRDKYNQDVARWTNSWGISVASFDDLIHRNFPRLGEVSSKADADLWLFSEEMVRTYLRIPCEEARQVDPNHLNLGMRYAWIASDLFYVAGDFFDVFSINCYQMEPAFETINTIAKKTKKPVLIGEYHFGALDRGLPATGLRGVSSQDERGIAYRRYLESGAANPNLVGAHYFTLNDQALLGRFDGENYQIGFVDCCHTPYSELVSQAVQAHENLYDIMMGSREPFARKAVEIPKIK
jgi:hypothetical protein